ncbi:hypothetical protein MRX96_046210 [Rhipicephalus microplus]
MKIYREQREPGLKDSEGTEMFTMQVNDLFDVLNAKHPATGIHKNSPKIKESLSSKRLEVLHQKKEREDKLGQLMHSIVLKKLPEEDAN